MQLFETRRISRRHRWLRHLRLPAVLGVVLGGWVVWDPAVARYHVWKQQRALAQAKGFIAKKDVANTQLALDVALRAVPGDADAIRMAADMLEQVGAPQAMRLRRAVARILPDSANDAAALVLCCLKFRDFNGAKDALHTMPPSVAQKPPALQAALAYALTTDDAPIADLLFQKLRELTPNDEGLRAMHALLRLRHPRPQERDAARKELEAMALHDPKLQIQIDRELAGAALLRQDYAEAKARLGRVIAAPEANFNDYLQRANLELLVDQRPFAAIFAELAPQAASRIDDVVALAQWALLQNRADDVARWIATLSPDMQQAQALRRVEADIAAQQRDVDRLTQLLRDGAWGTMSAETVRLAMAARTVDSPDHPALRQEIWDMAITSAGSNLGALTALLRLTRAWHWNEEFERTEWTVARNFPDQTWAFQDLFNLYRDKKNTNGMRDVLTKLRDDDADVPRYQHDWALLTLLTNPQTQWDMAKTTMQHLYESAPNDATYATGYAFALAQAGRGPEALAVISKLPAAERDYPPRQPYFAYVYGVAHATADVARTQTLVKGVTFLPEENALFDRAHEALRHVPEKPVVPQPHAAAPAAARKS